jgi:hypothetical protein
MNEGRLSISAGEPLIAGLGVWCVGLRCGHCVEERVRGGFGGVEVDSSLLTRTRVPEGTLSLSNTVPDLGYLVGILPATAAR